MKQKLEEVIKIHIDEQKLPTMYEIAGVYENVPATINDEMVTKMTEMLVGVHSRELARALLDDANVVREDVMEPDDVRRQTFLGFRAMITTQNRIEDLLSEVVRGMIVAMGGDPADYRVVLEFGNEGGSRICQSDNRQSSDDDTDR